MEYQQVPFRNFFKKKTFKFNNLAILQKLAGMDTVLKLTAYFYSFLLKVLSLKLSLNWQIFATFWVFPGT